MVFHFITTFRWVFHHPLQTLNNQGPFKQDTFLHNLLPFCKTFWGGECMVIPKSPIFLRERQGLKKMCEFPQHRFDFQTTNCDKIYRSTGEIHVVWWCLCNSRNWSDPLLVKAFSEALPTEKVLWLLATNFLELFDKPHNALSSSGGCESLWIRRTPLGISRDATADLVEVLEAQIDQAGG